MDRKKKKGKPRGKGFSFEKFLENMRALVLKDIPHNGEIMAVFPHGYVRGNDEEGEYIRKWKKLYPEKFGYEIVESETTETEIVFRKKRLKLKST